MARRAGRFARGCLSGETAGATILFIIVVAAVVTPVAVLSGATEKKLRSLITVNTPISGFYGPGSWWACLITLGMTHAHSFVATAEPEEWDYDLIAVSGYIVAAAIDLTLKARTIGKLGNRACGSPLLPAFLCAARVVWVGTGSSLFTIATAVFVGGSSGRRRAVTALIPFVFAVIAFWFTSAAHSAIVGTDPSTFKLMMPDSMCTLSDGSRLRGEDISSILVDLPLFIIWISIKVVPVFYMSGWYWLITVPITTVFAVAIPGGKPLVAGPVLIPLMVVIYAVVMVLLWLFLWGIVWPLLYVLAFFPQLGFFPLTGTSVMDMDQLAALLGIGFIAAFRTWRRIFKAVRDRANSVASTHEHLPLLPVDRHRSGSESVAVSAIRG
ncbi:hypothetical protein C8R45DRAFT_1006936 [Mycena sanguinolenta]|nr:hypothetical protein C8R45DRAFT_1006936 [Mycena sanguinolenta]